MAKKKGAPEWATTVTPFSKMLALFMFILLPIVAFYYGTYYQATIDLNRQQVKEVTIYKTITTQACSQPTDGTVICRSNADCPSDYTCTQAGPIRANGQNEKTCWKNGHAVPL